MTDTTKNNSLNATFFSELKGLIAPLFLIGFLDGVLVTAGTILLNDRIISFSDAFMISLYMILLYTILISIAGTVIFSGIYVSLLFIKPSFIIKKPFKQSVFLIIFSLILFSQFLNKFIRAYSYYSVFPFADNYWKMAILMWCAVIVSAIISIILAKLSATIYLNILRKSHEVLNPVIIITIIVFAYILFLVSPIFYNRSKISVNTIPTEKIKVRDSF